MTWIRTAASRIVFALVLSFGLWVYVSFSENPDRSTSFEGLPVEVVGLDPGLVIVDPNGLPRQDQDNLSPVDVEVTTDQSSLSRLRPQDLRAFVSLDELAPGDHQVPVQVDARVSSLRASNFATSPENLSVRLEERIIRTVPITIEVQGSLPFSFERGEPEVSLNGQEVDSVTVTGPRSRVERVIGAFAVADINQLRGNYVSALDLVPRDANADPLAGVSLDPPTVRVSIPIRSVVGLKRVPVLGQLEGWPAAGYVIASISSEPSLVNISGRSVVLDTIEFAETAPVDVTGATTTITERVSLLLPPGVSPDMEPPEVVVQVEVERLSRPFEVRLPFSVTVQGATDDLLVQVEPRFISVPVAGMANRLTQLDSATLESTVDVRGFDPGTYTLQPQVTLPEGVRLAGAVPSVEVTLSEPPTATPLPTRLPTPTDTATPQPEATSTPAERDEGEEPDTTMTEEPRDTPTPAASTATPTVGERPTRPPESALPTEEGRPPEGVTVVSSPGPFSEGASATSIIPSVSSGE